MKKYLVFFILAVCLNSCIGMLSLVNRTNKSLEKELYPNSEDEHHQILHKKILS